MERTTVVENDKIWVTVSATINLGNYENTKIDAGMSRTYKKKEDPLEVIEDVTDELITFVKETKKSIKNDSKNW